MNRLKNGLYVVFTIMVFSFCNDQHETVVAEQKKSEIIDSSLAKTTICYTYRNEKDTATMVVRRNGNIAEGELLYKLKEKDRNYGKIKGWFKNDLLICLYTFESEGMTSVREEIFRMEGSDLVPGYGEIIIKNDSVWFANPGALQFNSVIRFSPVECERLF